MPGHDTSVALTPNIDTGGVHAKVLLDAVDQRVHKRRVVVAGGPGADVVAAVCARVVVAEVLCLFLCLAGGTLWAGGLRSAAAVPRAVPLAFVAD